MRTTVRAGQSTGTAGLTQQRDRLGRAYRDGRLVCARVHVTISRDDRLGLAGHERRYVLARFQDHLDGPLRSELIALIRRRGAAARRVADSLDEIEIVLNAPDGEHERIIGRLQPPEVRHGRLRDIEFGLRDIEPTG